MEIKPSDVCVVEGVIETDPVTGYCTIQTEGGSFDPQVPMKHFAGQEVRFILVPMVTLVQLEEAAAALEKLGEIK